jgi:hypothetical protein
MSQIGYYRLKLDSLPPGTYQKSFFVDGEEAVTHTLIIKDWCDNKKLLKFADSESQFRFFPFNTRWQSTDRPVSLGKVNKFITTLVDSQSNTKQVGYKNERVISLVADDITEDELNVLSDIYVSDQIFLYIGDGNSDAKSDWVQVEITGGDKTVRRRRNNSGQVNIEITLPEYFSITIT